MVKEIIKVISVVGSYSLRNRGDELLLKGTILLFKEIFKENVKFNVFVTNPEEDSKYFSKEELKYITFYPHPLESERMKNCFYKILALIEFLYLLVWSFLFKLTKSNKLVLLLPQRNRQKVFALINSDYIIYRSIDQISDIFGLFVFFKVFLQILFYSNISKNPVILHAQTIYFNKNNMTRTIGKLAILYLLKVTKIKITLRDMYSVKWFRENNLIFHGIIPPPSLLVTEKIYKSKNVMKKEKHRFRILITPRVALRVSQNNKAKRYVELIERLLTEIEDLEVYIMGQSYIKEFQDDDTNEILLILSLLDNQIRNKVHIINTEDMSLLEILDTLQKFDCVISERAFTFVQALSLRIPAISIDPYYGKNLGLAELFDFNDFVVSINEFSNNIDKIANLCIEIIKNNCYYKRKLNEKVCNLVSMLLKNTKRLLVW